MNFNQQLVDTIYITALKIQAKIGVHQWEKATLQTLLLDIELHMDLSAAGHSDDLQDTLDYTAVAQTIQNIAVAHHYQLLECLAATLIQNLFEDDRIQAIRLKLNKPAALHNAQATGVVMCRSRKKP